VRLRALAYLAGRASLDNRAKEQEIQAHKIKSNQIKSNSKNIVNMIRSPWAQPFLIGLPKVFRTIWLIYTWTFETTDKWSHREKPN
jgi:hypothetical protein